MKVRKGTVTEARRGRESAIFLETSSVGFVTIIQYRPGDLTAVPPASPSAQQPTSTS